MCRRGRNRKVPEGTGRYRKVPEGTGRYRKISEGTGRYRKVPEGTGRSQKEPAGISASPGQIAGPPGLLWAKGEGQEPLTQSLRGASADGQAQGTLYPQGPYP